MKQRPLTAMEVAEGLNNWHPWKARTEDKTLYYYDEKLGYYKEAGAYLDEQIVEYLKNDRETTITRTFAAEVYFNLVITNYVKEEHAVPNELICVKNGVLNILTGELTPHTDKYFFLQRVEANWNPKADCPKIKKFLSEIVEEKHATTLLEFAAYCLWKEYPIQKALIAVGEGKNGKSVWTTLLAKFLGEENCVSLSLQRICEDKFARSRLYGKLAVFDADLPNTPIKNAVIFKQATGGDLIDGEMKFKNGFNFRNYAKFFFGTNAVPRTYDKTYAYFRRWVMVKFSRKFEGKDANPNLGKELMAPEEIEGLLRESVDRLKPLLERGDFTYAQTPDELEDEYMRASDPVTAFVAYECDLDGELVVLKTDLYAAYTRFCREKNYAQVMNLVGFSMALNKVIDVRDTDKNVNGKRLKAWRGLALKNKPVEEVEVKEEKTTKLLDNYDTMGDTL